MPTTSIQLSQLIGKNIEDVGTIRDDHDGDDMVYLYLSEGLAVGCDLRQLTVESDRDYADVWTDFTDHLEEDSPEEEDEKQPDDDDCLLLADLIGNRIRGLSTRRDGEDRWVFLHLSADLVLKIDYYQFVADGEYDMSRAPVSNPAFTLAEVLVPPTGS